MRSRAPLLGICTVVLALVSALTAPASWAKAVATDYRMEEGAWGGGSYNEESGEFAFCFMGTQTAAGDRIGVLLLADATLWLTIANDAWTLFRDQRYPAVIEADDTRRNVKGEAKMGGLVFDLHRDPGFFEAMRNGERLSFVGVSSTVSIDLRPDTFAALTALERCLAEHAFLNLHGKAVAGAGQDEGQGTASQNPFAPTAPPPSTAQPPTVAQSGDALADLILHAVTTAGFPDPKLRDEDGGYSWSSSKTGIIGTFLVNDPSTFPDEYAETMEGLADDCGSTAKLSFDVVATSRTGRLVYGATLNCPAKHYGIYQATLVDESVALMFFHVSPEPEAALAAKINSALRAHLTSRW